MTGSPSGAGRRLRFWHAVIHAITRRFRRRRGAMIRAIFPEIARFEVCDLGGSLHFWDHSGLGVPPERLTLFNVDRGETQSASGSPYARARFVLYDGKRIPVADRKFDLLVCNSVIEHVPPERRSALVLEMQRVARRVVLQTPAKEFPIEPHFLLPFVQWLPRSLGRYAVRVSPWRLLSQPSPETIEDYYRGTNLLTEREVRVLFPDAELRYERFIGLRKSYLVVWPANVASPVGE